MKFSGLYAVAGATGAVGRSIARQLKQYGAEPLLLGRDESALAELSGELGGCEFRQMDVTDSSSISNS
eukprot:CAMPEP_0182452108 /NCGR_PEP_ID=MMETSP1172-20130603/44076_1 /TAXON_ID=708627 /ORGANISM="Timspurckia oligopyrenoides, Strain CCMP3278" /LENGTH=67 /DNA_ID=CAMNT_0024649925 /DNA_START=1462 /DNA_END=1662 /DNA_ORIENTATION=-